MIYKKSLVVLLGAISYQIVAVIGGSPDIIGGGDPVTVTICSDYMWETDCPGPTPGLAHLNCPNNFRVRLAKVKTGGTQFFQTAERFGCDGRLATRGLCNVDGRLCKFYML